MEILIKEQEVEQQLIEELQKLKKAITYIEEAKVTASDYAKLLAAMDIKFKHMQEVNTDFQASVNTSEAKLLREVTSNKKLTDEEFKKIYFEIEQLSKAHEREFSELRKSNKILKAVNYFSLGVSTLLLLSSIAIVVAAFLDI